MPDGADSGTQRTRIVCKQAKAGKRSKEAAAQLPPPSASVVERVTFTVPPEENGERLDKVLATRFSSHSRQYLQNLVSGGLVTLDGQPIAKKNEKVKAGATLEVGFVPARPLRAEPEAIPLEVLYEDDHMIAVNKPAGMCVHPSAGNWTGTLVNALLHYFADAPLFRDYAAGVEPAPVAPVGEEGEEEAEEGAVAGGAGGADGSAALHALRPGIVHRLDKETSGILLVAKTAAAQQALMRLFHDRLVKKTYLAVVSTATPAEHDGQILTVDAPIGRHPVQRQKMSVVPTDEGGREALTAFRRIRYEPRTQLSALEVSIATGRTHQIRVHLATKCCPVLGDPLYGSAAFNKRYSSLAPRQMLHAYRLQLPHPVDPALGPLDIAAPVPADMAAVLARVGVDPLRPQEASKENLHPSLKERAAAKEAGRAGPAAGGAGAEEGAAPIDIYDLFAD
eukprot:tig00021318_g20172.t1